MLQCDISKFFASIDHAVLTNILWRRITDPKLRHLLSLIIESHADGPGRGIPIGNLTSQLFANLYMNEFDHFMKDTIQEPYYIRYMDDFIVVHHSPQRLRLLKRSVQHFLHHELKLELHPHKAAVRSAKNGVDFLGYRVLATHRKLKNATVRRFVRRTRRQQYLVRDGLMEKERHLIGVQSWNAYARYAKTWRLRKRLYRDLGIEDEWLFF